jgi:hypothetical protein
VDQNQLLQLMTQQLSGSPGLPESLAELAASDPQLSQLSGLLAERERQLTERLAQEEEEERLAQEELLAREDQERRRDEVRRRGQAVRRYVEELTGELAAVRATLDELAAALGACPECFGADPDCRWCRGRGGPGHAIPDPESFRRLVLPAVRTHVRLHGRVSITPPGPRTAEGRDT